MGDMLIAIGDFNAGVGTHYAVWKGDLDARSIAALAPAGLCPRPAARSRGRDGNQGALRRQWLSGPPPRRLQDEAPSAFPQEAKSNQLIHRPEDLPTPDKYVHMEDRWRHLREAVHSTVVGVLNRAHRQYMGWSQDNAADVTKLLDEKNGLQ
nr:unnamed protein product [Spirometra erinaceieuropaei]